MKISAFENGKPLEISDVLQKFNIDPFKYEWVLKKLWYTLREDANCDLYFGIDEKSRTTDIKMSGEQLMDFSKALSQLIDGVLVGMSMTDERSMVIIDFFDSSYITVTTHKPTNNGTSDVKLK